MSAAPPSRPRPEDHGLRVRLKKRRRYLHRSSFTTRGRQEQKEQQEQFIPSSSAAAESIILPGELQNVEQEVPHGLLLSSVVHPRAYTGVLDPDLRSVTLQDSPGAAEELFNHGFYGKGTLSRSRPQFDVPLEPWKTHFPLEDRREMLQLAAVEAFWLQHALGCLRVLRRSPEASSEEEGKEAHDSVGNQRFLGVQDAWELFNSVNPRFLELYTVYFFLRSRGWVVRSGLKYGVDFVIYRLGPHQTHAEYSVVVESHIPGRGGGGEEGEREMLEKTVGQRLPRSWIHVQSALRTTHNVAKSLMTAQVILAEGEGGPEPRAEGFWDSPDCLEALAVRTFVISRARILHSVGAVSSAQP